MASPLVDQLNRLFAFARYVPVRSPQCVGGAHVTVVVEEPSAVLPGAHACVRSTDAKVDLYNSLLRQLCLQAAHQVKATKVLLASTANRSAMQVLCFS